MMTRRRSSVGAGPLIRKASRAHSIARWRSISPMNSGDLGGGGGNSGLTPPVLSGNRSRPGGAKAAARIEEWFTSEGRSSAALTSGRASLGTYRPVGFRSIKDNGSGQATRIFLGAPLRLRGSPPGGAANSRSPSVTRLDRRRLGPPRSAQGPRGRLPEPARRSMTIRAARY